MNASPRRPYSIRRRVAVLVGFGTVAPILVALLAMRSAFDEVSLHLLEEHRLLARSLALHFDRDLRDSQSALLSAAGTPEDFATGNARRALRATLLRSPILEAIVVLAREAGKAPTVLWRELRHDTVDDAMLLGLPAVGAAFSSGRQDVARIGGLRRFAFLVPIRDPAGEIAQVIVAIANPEAPSWLAVLRQGALGSGHARLVDDQERVLADLGGSAELSDDDIIAQGRLSVVPWQVVLRQMRKEALGPLEHERTRLMILSPLLLVLAVLFSWGAAHSVTEPLAALNEAARRIAEGNLDAAVPPQPGDEVGRLGRSLETMRLSLKASMDELTGSHEILERRVQDRTRELRLLFEKLVSAQEDERRRIARELHDEACQTVAALGMKLDAAAAAPTFDEVRDHVKEARAFASRTLAEIHALIYELRPSVLDDLGLYPAIRWLGDRHLTPAGIDFRCEVNVSDHGLPTDHETTLFRAIQEAIRNIARHAGASQVLIQVEEHERELVVEIEDDGHGFDPSSVNVPGPNGRGLGLLGMRERMSAIGGTVEIISSAEEGTRVVLRVPFPRGSAEMQHPTLPSTGENDHG